jgi:hypothetical protein
MGSRLAKRKEAELLPDPELLLQLLAHLLAPAVARVLAGEQLPHEQQRAPKRRRPGSMMPYCPPTRPSDLQIARARRLSERMGLSVKQGT